MNKSIMVFIGNLCIVGATFADISTGFHVGTSLHYGASHATSTGQVRGVPVTGSTRDVGGNSGNIGFHGGYGFVVDGLYIGIESGYNIDNSKIEDTLGKGGPYGISQLTRDGYINAHIRAGVVLNKSTLFYVNFGGTHGKWKLRDSLNNGFSNLNPAAGSKSSFSLSPCIGIETEVDKNLNLRIEYSHEFGANVKAVSPNAKVTNNHTKMDNIRTHYGKIGFSYKL